MNINFGYRTSEPIVGEWGLLPDPMERCRRQTWWKSSRKPGYFFPSYDEDAFWPTEVPGVYNILHPQLEFYEGCVVYRVHFQSAPAAQGEKVFLVFNGVADRCQVFLNGKLAGEHDGPYTPFSCDITGLLAEQNRLMILVDCQREKDAVPGEIHDWFHYGGIHRPVQIYRVPALFIQDAALETSLRPDGKVRLRLGVRLQGSSREMEQSVNAKLVDEQGTPVAQWDMTARPGIWERGECEIPRDTVQLWSPENPRLYHLVVECGGDSWCDEVGLREIRTHGRELRLNGERLILRGVCTWIHDGRGGLFAQSQETLDKLVDTARRLHANYLRAAHWPVSREFVRTCDRAGLLLWMEIPAYWMPNMAEPAPMSRALSCAEEMLCAFRNSPSVILWSVGNECVFHDTEKPQTNLAYFVRAAEFFHSHDSTRLVTFTGGMEGEWTPNMDKVCPAALVEHLDVIGMNSYSGITDGAEGASEQIDTLVAGIETAGTFGKPVLLAENGIDAMLGEEGFDFGEARQEEYYRKTCAIVSRLSEAGKLQGVSFFVLCDFRTPIKLSHHQNGYNRKGLLTTDFQPKKAFHVVAEAFAGMEKR